MAGLTNSFRVQAALPGIKGYEALKPLADKTALRCAVALRLSLSEVNGRKLPALRKVGPIYQNAIDHLDQFQRQLTAIQNTNPVGEKASNDLMRIVHQIFRERIEILFTIEHPLTRTQKILLKFNPDNLPTSSFVPQKRAKTYAQVLERESDLISDLDSRDQELKILLQRTKMIPGVPGTLTREYLHFGVVSHTPTAGAPPIEYFDQLIHTRIQEKILNGANSIQEVAEKVVEDLKAAKSAFRDLKNLFELRTVLLTPLLDFPISRDSSSGWNRLAMVYRDAEASMMALEMAMEVQILMVRRYKRLSIAPVETPVFELAQAGIEGQKIVEFFSSKSILNESYRSGFQEGPLGPVYSNPNL